jgi:hypothetical protein
MGTPPLPGPLLPRRRGGSRALVDIDIPTQQMRETSPFLLRRRGLGRGGIISKAPLKK